MTSHNFPRDVVSHVIVVIRHISAIRQYMASSWFMVSSHRMMICFNVPSGGQCPAIKLHFSWGFPSHVWSDPWWGHHAGASTLSAHPLSAVARSQPARSRMCSCVVRKGLARGKNRGFMVLRPSKMVGVVFWTVLKWGSRTENVIWNTPYIHPMLNLGFYEGINTQR